MAERAIKSAILLLVLSVCAAAPPLLASDADGERGISVLDRHPECMDRALNPAERKKCEVRDSAAKPAPRKQGGAGATESVSSPNNTVAIPGSTSQARGGAASGSSAVTGGAASR